MRPFLLFLAFAQYACEMNTYTVTPPAVPAETGPPFDAQAARAALARIDLSPCASHGVPSGVGHAKISFNPDGRISKVVVDDPPGLPADASRCIGDRFGALTIAEYRGSLIEMGTSWRVP